jgi:hypothetical protein
MNVATLTGLLLPDEPGLSCYVQYVDGEGQATLLEDRAFSWLW